MNLGRLKEMTRKKMVHGFPSIGSHDKFCEGCVIGKHLRSSFSKATTYRAKRPLELVHTNICEPIKPISIGEK